MIEERLILLDRYTFVLMFSIIHLYIINENKFNIFINFIFFSLYHTFYIHDINIKQDVYFGHLYQEVLCQIGTYKTFFNLYNCLPINPKFYRNSRVKICLLPFMLCELVFGLRLLPNTTLTLSKISI